MPRPDPRQCRLELLRIFTGLLDCSDKLLNCMEQEHTALCAGNTDQIESLNSDKIKHLEVFDRLDKEREALCAAAGFSDEKDGTEACIKWCDENSQLQLAWSRLTERARSCQEMNQSNGSIVEVSRRHVQRALEILRGQSPTVELYKPSGDTLSGVTGRTLGKA